MRSGIGAHPVTRSVRSVTTDLPEVNGRWQINGTLITTRTQIGTFMLLHGAAAQLLLLTQV
ncbi:hypothetical protein IBA8401_06690 [Pseudomonas syringae]